MKFGMMFKDVSGALFKKPFTENYPDEPAETPDRLRGSLVWDPDTCTGCGLCARDCPAMALEIEVIDKKAKHYLMTYHVDRCTFCGQCVESCNQGSLLMEGGEWELASLSREPFTEVNERPPQDGGRPPLVVEETE